MLVLGLSPHAMENCGEKRSAVRRYDRDNPNTCPNGHAANSDGNCYVPGCPYENARRPFEPSKED
jgi:hypothetical protein